MNDSTEGEEGETPASKATPSVTPAAVPNAEPTAAAPKGASSRAETSPPPKRRKKILTLMAGVFLLAIVGYGAWWAIVGSHYESTDDAYVAGNVVQVMPQVTGTVVAIRADDTDQVRAGQELVVLDKADAEVALEQAEAQLAQTVREVRTLYANNGTLSANIASRTADVARSRNALAKAQDDYRRRAGLVESGAVSKEELQHIQAELDAARSTLAAAEAGANAAREQLGSNRALTEGTSIEQHPNVARAAARVREAYLALNRVTILAPISGQVAKRSVQVGQRVQPGTPLMAVVPLNHLWVDANFKEIQLRKMRINQPVTLEADVYGSKVEYRGRIVGLAAGTGSAFSLLPAQNATGNWIKVVQRVPVRIEFDNRELAEHPLRVGLSVVAKVDVSNQEGAQIATLSPPLRTTAAYQTETYSAQDGGADSLVKKIIAANLGRSG